MTDHPCGELGEAATAAFELIATGEALPPMKKATAAKLLSKGLIERGPDKELGDRFGRFAIPQYFVPLAVHMRWCQWCSEQPENAEG